MVQPRYPLETPRLLLRPFTAADRAELFDLYSRADVVRYLYREPCTDTELDARTVLEKEGDGIDLAVVPRGLGTVVGNVNLFWRSEQHGQGELGFIVHPDHQGRGYAQEASLALLHVGFDQRGLHRIVGRLDGRNGASARVLERLGMRREAHLVENEWVKGEWTDELVYALLDREWQSRAAAGPHRPG